MPSSPDSLYELMKKYLQSKSVEFLSCNENCTVEKFKLFQNKYLKDLPISVLDDLMNDLLLHLSENRKSQLILRTIYLMLSESTKSLCIYPFDYTLKYQSEENSYFINRVIMFINMKKPKLTHLEINYNFINSIDLKTILKCFPSLKSLIITSEFIEKEMMKNILKFCPTLKELKLNVSQLDFRKIQINSWPKQESLCAFRINILALNCFKILSTNPDEILEKLPNLKIFETNDFLLNLILSKKISLNLKTMLNDKSTSLTLIHKLNEIYREIDSIFLKSPHNGVLEYIPNFLKLKQLAFFNCTQVQMMQVLKNCGSKLESLIFDIDHVNLSSVLKLCPNLINLDIDLSSDLVVDNQVVNSHSKLKYFKGHEIPINIMNFFKGLRSIECVRTYDWSVYFPSELDALILSLKHIKILHVYSKCGFTLNCLQKITRECHNLKELVLPSINNQFNFDDVQMYIQNNNSSVKLINYNAYQSIHKYV